jgi:hypothetical protein
VITVAKLRTAAAGAVLRRRIRTGARAARSRARGATSRLLELGAYALFTAAGWHVSPALGMAVAAIALLVLAHGIERPPPRPQGGQ